MCMSSLQNIDNIVRTTATKCINVDLSGACWNQASLPIRFGDLGIRSVADLSLPCYIATAFLNASTNLVGLGQIRVPSIEPFINFRLQLKYDNHDLPKGESASLQQTWDEIAASTVFQELIRSTNQVHRASSPWARGRFLRGGGHFC